MSAPTLVVPLHEPLLRRLEGRRVIVRLPAADAVPQALQVLGRAPVELHALSITVPGAVTAVPFAEAWGRTPIAVFAERVGPFRDIAKRMRVLRKLNVRLYLSTDHPECYRGARILASLGIPAAVTFGESVDWDQLADLAAYALLGLGPRAPISPFNDVADRYSPRERTDFSHVYFEGPEHYLHLDEKGRVALSAAELRRGSFVAETLDADGGLGDAPEYRERVDGWRRFFVEPGGCASCPGWRVCLGKFEHMVNGSGGCSEFFVELMDLVERNRARAGTQDRPWQP